MSDPRLWLGLAAGLYAIVLVLGAVAVGRRRPIPRTPLLTLLLLAFASQSAGLYIRGMAIGSCPVGNPYEVLHFISWSTLLVYLLVGPVFRLSLLGGASTTTAALLAITASLVPQWDYAHPPLFGGSMWIELHAALALLSYGVFGILAATSVLYLLQNFSLKTKRYFRLLSPLPSIAQLEQVNFRLLLLAVGVFSAALSIGSVSWLQSWGETTWIKAIPTVLLWCACLLVLSLRWGHRLQGPRLAWSCLSLFLVALLALWPVELDQEERHSRTPLSDA